MSKYIDVDKFIHDISIDYIYAMETGAETWCELPKTYPPNATQIAIELIKRADSADVIPITWLEQEIKKLISIGSPQSIFYGKELLKIIDNWRKENETDRC